jgi:aminoglycoside phosphotransferase (APT) family kinase protein
MSTDRPGSRSRYYDAILNTLDSDIKPYLESSRALYSYNLICKQLARLATINENTPCLPENLASLDDGKIVTGTSHTSAGSPLQRLKEEGQRLDEIEQATSARLMPRERGAATVHVMPEAISTKSVEAYLQANLDPAIKVSELRILSGGRSKQTILVMLTDALSKPVEWVIRRDIDSSMTGGSVPEEYGVLSILAKHGIPVPRPILCEPDASKLCSPFIIVDKIVGTLSGHIFDPPSEAAVLDSARVLGQLHALSVAEIAPALRKQFQVAPNPTKIRALIESLRKTWDENSRAQSATIDFALNWLRENVDNLHPLQSIVHGDCSYHNILFDKDKVSALLDWELVRVGHPAEDLGYIRPAVLKRVSWNAFMSAYHSGGGPAIGINDQLFYTLLEKLRLLTMLFKTRPYIESGASDDIELVDALVIVIPRILHQMSVELREYMKNSD